MRVVQLVVVLGIVIAAPSAAADRLTDRDVKALVSRIEDGRDRFDDALDDRLKRSIVRGASGEVNVARFLDDFQESIDHLEERLKPEYAASSEVAAVLRQASGIERFFREQPAGTQGESEWNRLATDLKLLAAAYGTDFPIREGAAVRRVGDRELAAELDQASKSASRFKKALDNDLKKNSSIDSATREEIVREADQLSKDAKTVRERVNDGKPSSAEAEQLLARASKLQAFVANHQVPSAASAWTEIRARLQTVAGAYGMAWPSAT
jgi:hypothetical protein